MFLYFVFLYLCFCIFVFLYFVFFVFLYFVFLYFCVWRQCVYDVSQHTNTPLLGVCVCLCSHVWAPFIQLILVRNKWINTQIISLLSGNSQLCYKVISGNVMFLFGI